MLFFILLWFSVGIQFAMFRYNSVSLTMGMNDAKYPGSPGKWIPSEHYMITIHNNNSSGLKL